MSYSGFQVMAVETTSLPEIYTFITSTSILTMLYCYCNFLAQLFFWDFYLSVALSVRHSITSGDHDFGIVISVPHNECVHFGMMLKEIVQLLLFVTSSLSVCLL